jgi:hypothetical protein
LFRGSIPFCPNDDIDVASGSGLGAGGNGKPTDEGARDSQVRKLADDALERTLDGI